MEKKSCFFLCLSVFGKQNHQGFCERSFHRFACLEKRAVTHHEINSLCFERLGSVLKIGAPWEILGWIRTRSTCVFSSPVCKSLVNLSLPISRTSVPVKVLSKGNIT